MSANNELTRPQQKALARLKELYTRVPTFECKPDCSDCCDYSRWSETEWLNISLYLKALNREVFIPFVLGCPYIKNHRCSIYEVRPMICRLYGSVETLPCPHGYGPNITLPHLLGVELWQEAVYLLPPSSHGIGEI